MPEVIAYYKPGADITGHAAAAVTGGRCVKISASRLAKATLTTPQVGAADPTGGGNVQVQHADAAAKVFGVASHDAAIGKKVTILRPPQVVPIEAEAAIAFFEEVKVGTNGRVIPHAGVGVAIGYALTAAAINTLAEIHLY